MSTKDRIELTRAVRVLEDVADQWQHVDVVDVFAQSAIAVQRYREADPALLTRYIAAVRAVQSAGDSISAHLAIAEHYATSTGVAHAGGPEVASDPADRM